MGMDPYLWLASERLLAPWLGDENTLILSLQYIIGRLQGHKSGFLFVMRREKYFKIFVGVNLQGLGQLDQIICSSLAATSDIGMPLSVSNTTREPFYTQGDTDDRNFQRLQLGPRKFSLTGLTR